MAETVLLNATRSEAAALLGEQEATPASQLLGGSRVQDSAEGLPPGRYETYMHKTVEVEGEPIGAGNGDGHEEDQQSPQPAGKPQMMRLWAPPSRGSAASGFPAPPRPAANGLAG